MTNVARKEGYSQVCVWPGTIVGKGEEKKMEEFFKDELNVRVQFLEVIETGPDQDEAGNPVEDTGGRQDVFLAVHEEDVQSFAIPRLQFGIRWIEDVLANGNYRDKIYPARVFDYKTWNADGED